MPQKEANLPSHLVALPTPELLPCSLVAASSLFYLLGLRMGFIIRCGIETWMPSLVPRDLCCSNHGATHRPARALFPPLLCITLQAERSTLLRAVPRDAAAALTAASEALSSAPSIKVRAVCGARFQGASLKQGTGASPKQPGSSGAWRRGGSRATCCSGQALRCWRAHCPHFGEQQQQ